MKKEYPIYINRKSPCYANDHLGNSGCPAKNDIPRFLYLIFLRRFEEAFYILKETNPFSAGCGRFCDHPCETSCNRAKFDQPVDIKALERFVTDWGYHKGLKPKIKKDYNGKQVAIIGSGPAGLSCAYFLALHGYRTKIFEEHENPGGILFEGIPSFRYPREILDKELSYIKDCGVEIKTNYFVDKNRFINIAEEFDAVIVATGAISPNLPGIEGDTMKGVENGVEFLRKVNTGHTEEVKIAKCEKVGVIGGGYTAFDVARVLLRLGADASVIYRRTVDEMTAHPGEVSEVSKEGASFHFLRQPVKITKKNGTLHMLCQVMKMGPVDESGRAKPIPVQGKSENFLFDRIIMATGDKPDLFFVGESFTLEFPRLYCPDMPEHLRDKIFLSGDAAMGTVESTGMVVKVVGLAQETSDAVRNYLGENIINAESREIAYYKDLNIKYFQKSSRMVEKTISIKERKGNFKEIIETIDEDLAVSMASRCFFCGICIQCDWCYFYSNGSLVKIDKKWISDIDEFFYYYIKDKIQPASYKSVEACPRAALSVIKEGTKGEKYIEKQYIGLNDIDEEDNG